VQFDILSSAHKQSKGLIKGDRVSVVYEIMGMDKLNIKHIEKIRTTDKIPSLIMKEDVISVQEAEDIIEYIFRRPDIGISVYSDPKFDVGIHGIKYYNFYILYGLNMVKSPELEADTVTRAFINRDKSVYRAVRGIDDKWEIGDRIGVLLQLSDLEAVYMDSVIKLGMSAKDVLDKIGNGSASEENNYGFIGWSDDNQYKYYYHEYEGFSIHTKVNIIDGASVISQINLKSIPTKRGIKVGNTYRMLFLAYGAPTYSEERDGKTYSVYEYDGSTISFGIDKDEFIDEMNSINKSRDIAANMLGIKDWRTLNATNYQDGENLYISFDGKSDDGKYTIGVRRTKDTTVRWWYYFDPVTFEYEIKQ